MHFLIRAIGSNPPSWVENGFLHYQSMLRPPYKLDITTYKPSKRSSRIDAMLEESTQLLHNLPRDALCIELDPLGQTWDTLKLAKKVDAWRMERRTVVLMIGGAYGHHPSLDEKVAASWSLSPLTLPHMLVRVILAEQIYRLCSIHHGHPYHK